MVRPARTRAAAALLALLAVLAGACGDGGPEVTPSVLEGPVRPAGADDAAALSGVGSSLVEPLVQAWASDYRLVAPAVSIAFEPLVPVAAASRFGAPGPDFLATDVPLTVAEEEELGGREEVVHVPWATSAIALPYNLPGVPELRLSPDTVGAIFSGRAQRWDDPAIRADNPAARLPPLAIGVVFPAEASGTTAVFTSYLQAAAPGGWALGSSATPPFPRGQGAAGPAAVVAAVGATAGAIGYAPLAYARAASAPVASLGNRSGRYLQPTPAAVNAAMAGATLRPASLAATLLFTPEAPGAYPLSTLTYVVYQRTGVDPTRAAALRHFVSWALTEGQRYAEPLGYGPVPRQFAGTALAAIDRPLEIEDPEGPEE